MPLQDNSGPRHVKSFLPQVDLSDDAARQTVVDREGGQYLGHPDTVLLEDGKTLLAVYPKGHAEGSLVLKKSADGGRTWGDRQAVPENWATSISCPTLHRMTDAKGKERLILLTGNESKNQHPVRSAFSEDEGQTWTPLAPIGGPGYSSVVTGSTVVRLKNGDYMALQHFHDGDFLQLYKMLTADGGLTWSEPVQITHFENARLCEPGAVRSPDGGQIAVLIRDNRFDHYKSWVVFSNDEGETWSPPKLLAPALTGHRHVAKYAPDGRIVITFRDMGYDSETWGDWVAWVGTYQDLAGGGEGEYRVRLKENKSEDRPWDCAYPGLELLPDGTFCAVTYGHWDAGEKAYIMGVHFRLSELDGMIAGKQ